MKLCIMDSNIYTYAKVKRADEARLAGSRRSRNQRSVGSIGRKGRCLLLGNFLARRTTRRNISSNNKIGGTCTGACTITELTIVETCEFSNSWLL